MSMGCILFFKNNHTLLFLKKITVKQKNTVHINSHVNFNNNPQTALLNSCLIFSKHTIQSTIKEIVNVLKDTTHRTK